MINHNTTVSKLQGKKVLGLKLAESFKRLGQVDRGIRVEQCGTFLEFTETKDGAAHLTGANFCRERLCPACQWRRSVRIFASTSSILDYIEQQDERAKLLFLTLTVANCPPDQLGKTIDTMAEAFNRLRNNQAWKSRVKGCMRTLEVTINHETGTFHPHYHLILVVDKDYAKKGSKVYWSQERWAEVWQKSARLEYKPHVWIETVKGRRQGVEEVSKYMAKDCDYILPKDSKTTDRIVSVLLEHMAGRRLISYTGCMLAAQRALKLADPESGPLTDSIRGDLVAAIRRYHWNAGVCRYSERKEEK